MCSNFYPLIQTQYLIDFKIQLNKPSSQPGTGVNSVHGIDNTLTPLNRNAFHENLNGKHLGGQGNDTNGRAAGISKSGGRYL